MHDVPDLRDVARDELTQRLESGADVEQLRPEVAAALDAGDDASLLAVLGRLEAAPLRAGWPWHEPSDLDGILAELGSPPAPAPVAAEVLDDRIHAAWLGRCAGCMLGKPLEGCTLEEARGYLRRVGAYPLLDYVPPLEPMPEGLLHPSWPETTRGRITAAVRDDDLDYTILALHLLETYGFGYSTADVALEWLERLPFYQVYTAERAAYRNLVLGLDATAAATERNPWREYIGAQIRADMFGYVSPGDPLAAARLAHPDASLSHTANGIYGAMWVAALVAAAFAAGSAREALDRAAQVVPARSRLAGGLRLVDELHAEGLDWDAARDRLEDALGDLNWVHTIPNAATVAAALLWGEGDFSRTLGLAVQGGWDTDCNGATAGSVFGAMHGTEALPAHWTEPLHDRVHSALFGFEDLTISGLAARTATLARGRLPGAELPGGGAQAGSASS